MYAILQSRLASLKADAAEFAQELVGVESLSLHEEQVAELARLAVRQQNTLDVLSSDIASLRATVCRLDPGAPPCEP